MARSDDKPADLTVLAQSPQVRLLGTVSEELLKAFHDQLGSVAPGEGPIAVELTSMGGDAEIGRRLALEVARARARVGRPPRVIGQTAVD